MPKDKIILILRYLIAILTLLLIVLYSVKINLFNIFGDEGSNIDFIFGVKDKTLGIQIIIGTIIAIVLFSNALIPYVFLKKKGDLLTSSENISVISSFLTIFGCILFIPTFLIPNIFNHISFEASLNGKETNTVNLILILIMNLINVITVTIGCNVLIMDSIGNIKRVLVESKKRFILKKQNK